MENTGATDTTSYTRGGRLRIARVEDAPAVSRIYNETVIEGCYANCDIDPVSVELYRPEIAAADGRHRYYVFEDAAGEIRAWSAIKKWSARPHCDSITEVAVYVDRQARNRVIGGALLYHLVVEATALGYAGMIAIVLAKNVASIRGLQAGGFEEIARFHEVARHRDEWIDIVWLFKSLLQPDIERMQRYARLAALAGLPGFEQP